MARGLAVDGLPQQGARFFKAQTHARHLARAAPCPTRAGGPPVPWRRQNQLRSIHGSRAGASAQAGRHFCPGPRRFCRGTPEVGGGEQRNLWKNLEAKGLCAGAAAGSVPLRCRSPCHGICAAKHRPDMTFRGANDFAATATGRGGCARAAPRSVLNLARPFRYAT